MEPTTEFISTMHEFVTLLSWQTKISPENTKLHLIIRKEESKGNNYFFFRYLLNRWLQFSQKAYDNKGSYFRFWQTIAILNIYIPSQRKYSFHGKTLFSLYLRMFALNLRIKKPGTKKVPLAFNIFFFRKSKHNSAIIIESINLSEPPEKKKSNNLFEEYHHLW